MIILPLCYGHSKLKQFGTDVERFVCYVCCLTSTSLFVATTTQIRAAFAIMSSKPITVRFDRLVVRSLVFCSFAVEVHLGVTFLLSLSFCCIFLTFNICLFICTYFCRFYVILWVVKVLRLVFYVHLYTILLQIWFTRWTVGTLELTLITMFVDKTYILSLQYLHWSLTVPYIKVRGWNRS